VIIAISRRDRFDPHVDGRCASNLSQIAKACIIYANEHHNVFPSDVALLVPNDDLVTETFVCHLSDATKAQDDLPFDELQKALASPLHNSYVYCGDGLKGMTWKEDVVIAFEPPGYHERGWMPIAFADSHVEIVSIKKIGKSKFDQLIQDAKSGVRPVRFKP